MLVWCFTKLLVTPNPTLSEHKRPTVKSKNGDELTAASSPSFQQEHGHNDP